jgi:hypothetical protein
MSSSHLPKNAEIEFVDGHNGNAKSKTPATDRLLAKGYEIYSVAPGKIERLLPNGARVRIPSPQR